MVGTGVEAMSEPTLVAAEERARADTYSLLGGLLARPPDATALNLFQQIDIPDIHGPARNGHDMATAWSVLKLAAQRASEQALEDEYYDLFIGLGRGELVPHGSWYLTGFLMERPLGELRRDLARLGFERDPDVHEPEDHVAALCETMALIVASGGDIVFDDQRAFFNVHLEPWMGRFFRDLRIAESASFYAAVGEFGERFMELEKRYFSMLV